MIKSEEINEFNKVAITNYLKKEYPIKSLNEYFFINHENVINDLLLKIENRSERENMTFLTNFFWNNSDDNYSIYENVGKILLRLANYHDDNTLIEVKDLNIEEKLNLIKNLDNVVASNNSLKKLFQIEDQKLHERILKIISNEDSVKKIKELYCGGWLEENVIDEVVEHGKKFFNAIALHEKLSKLNTKKSIKKHKI